MNRPIKWPSFPCCPQKVYRLFYRDVDFLVLLPTGSCSVIQYDSQVTLKAVRIRLSSQRLIYDACIMYLRPLRTISLISIKHLTTLQSYVKQLLLTAFRSSIFVCVTYLMLIYVESVNGQSICHLQQQRISISK